MTGDGAGHPLPREKARRAAAPLLEAGLGDGTEIFFTSSRTALTRFARSQIIQNTVRSDVVAHVRVALANRSATATTNQLDADSLARAGERALTAARIVPQDPEFPGLPRSDDVGEPTPQMRWDDATAAASPAARADAVESILAAAKGADSAGIYETSAHDFAVLSTEGIECYDSYTRCVTTCLSEVDGATGWDEGSGHAMGEVDVASIARTAMDKARAGKGASEGDPGSYEVVLEAPAVATLLEYLAYAGFGAKQMIEGESFLSTRRGERVAAPEVTLRDDVTHPLSVGIGFDFEGLPRRPVAVIESGVARGPVTDLRTARLLGEEPTGHFSGSHEYGPYASHLVVPSGDKSLVELISGVSDGFLVTRFHYVNILDRQETLLTGMTRDGTFRIRDGSVAEPVMNFRFAQSALDALATVEAIGSELRSFAPEYGSFGSTVVPPLHIGEFRFASTTSH